MTEEPTLAEERFFEHRQKFKLILSGLTQQEQDTMIGLLEKALQTAEAQK